MNNTVLDAQDYKNIVGLVEAIPRSYTSNIKAGYKVISRLYDCAVASKLPGFSQFSNDYTKLQEMVENSEKVKWDDPNNNFSVLPSLDLKDIKNDIARITYGLTLSVKEVKTLHKYLLKHKKFNLFEAVQEGYMKNLGENMQFHILDLFTSSLNDGLIEMKEFNKPLWKNLVEYNSSRWEKYVAKDILDLFTKIMIKNKEGNYLENDWVVENINNFFNSQKTINKSTVKKLGNFIDEFKQLNTSRYEISAYLTKYLDNSTAIKEKAPKAYHWEVDLNHLSLTEDISVKLLKDNIDEVIKVLVSEKYKLPGVINLHTARSKNLISLFVLYDEGTSIPNIKNFLTLSVDMTRQKIFFDADTCKEMWTSLKLHTVLNDSLTEKPQSSKSLKI